MNVYVDSSVLLRELALAARAVGFAVHGAPRSPNPASPG